MVKKPKVVAFIPARRDSERLPGKNKKEFCGKALILWTIDLAIKCKFIDEIFISTNDQIILDYCKIHYISSENKKITISKRPEELAQSDTPLMDVLKYELREYGDNTHIILLQPTSPLRTYDDINQAYNTFFQGICRGITPGITPAVGAYFDEKNKCFQLKGIIFIGRKDIIFNNEEGFFKDPHIICIPKERSIDIDTLEDFQKAEEYMRAQLEVEREIKELQENAKEEVEKMMNKLRHIP